MSVEESIISKKKRKRKTKNISFETEILTKSEAPAVLAGIKSKKGSKKNANKEKNLDHSSLPTQNTTETEPLINNQTIENKNKNNKLLEMDQEEDNDSSMDNTEVDNLNQIPDLTEINQSISGNTNKKESRRAQKRKRHKELLDEKKKKIEVAAQQKCLNYLSQWKHNKNDWKFEKLKQIWLQQNMFDTTKVPDKCWDMLVEYFESAKGQAKAAILKEALKYIENSEVHEEDEIKIKRARHIVLSLQE